MSAAVIVGLLSLAGTVIGTLGGIMASNKLTVYRIEQLEQKVMKHNNLVERMALVEKDDRTQWHEINEIKEKLDETIQ